MASSEQTTNRILIVGAGPCGLLTAALLLQRERKYHVTLVDAGDDLSLLTDVSQKRSWLIGLSEKGIEALSKVPGLYEEYVQAMGTRIQATAFYFREKKFEQKEKDIPAKLQKLGVKQPRNFVVDRNAIVAASTTFLRDHHGENPNFVTHWNTKVLYVDGHHKRALVRKMYDKQHAVTPLGEEENESYIDYDYVIGCDGVRSVVRAMMQTHLRNLTYNMSDTFSNFKSVHIQTPAGISPHSLLILVESLPNITMVGAPQPGGMMNLLIGHFKHNTIASELLSLDVHTVECYIKTHFKALDLVDCADFAQQWVSQEWSTTSQLHCSLYHSEKLAAIIMGDAAHATSPALSLGMNTGLDDAQTLYRLLDDLQDDWTRVLPAFSTERVKEGQALTELSFHLYALRPSLQLRMFARGRPSRYPVALFSEVCQTVCYFTQCMLGYPLSEVYKFATRTKRLSKTRPDNNRIQRKHFETMVGLA